jgi:prepilin-type N-terminal cleavage/methylation domain-containing protein
VLRWQALGASLSSGTLSARIDAMRNRLPNQPGGRSGFTMIELALTLTVIAIMTAMMIPRFGRVMNSTRVNRTAAIVAGDLEQAFTLAGRYRKPMRITVTPGTATYTVTDVTGGAVRLRRQLRDADLGNMTLAQENPAGGATVDVFPSGVSTDLLRVRITAGNSSRRVTLSTAGLVRIIP